MTEALIQAIRERIVAGQSKEEIIQAVQAMGHTEEVTQAAYTLATSDLTNPKNSSLHLSARALFTRGWQFVKTHPRLAVVGALPLVAEVFLTAGRNTEWGNDGEYFTALTVISVLTAIVYLFLLMVILLRVTQPQTPLTMNTALSFIKKHFLPLCLIYLLSGLMILGGFFLLVLPAFAVMISITFAQYVYLHEGKRGVAAILASSALVRGRFWYIVYKILAFVFLSMLPMLGLMIVLGILDAFHESTVSNLAGEALLQVLAGALTMVNLHAMNSAYGTLKQHDLSLEGSLNPKARYIFMMVMGVVVIGLIAAMYAFADRFDFLDELPVIETPSGVQQQVAATHAIAERYLLENNQSYAGVCESLTTTVTESTEVLCNDSGEAWALTAGEADGTLWCADTNTPAKQIQAPLQDRTECFPL